MVQKQAEPRWIPAGSPSAQFSVVSAAQRRGRSHPRSSRQSASRSAHRSQGRTRSPPFTDLQADGVPTYLKPTVASSQREAALGQARSCSPSYSFVWRSPAQVQWVQPDGDPQAHADPGCPPFVPPQSRSRSRGGSCALTACYAPRYSDRPSVSQGRKGRNSHALSTVQVQRSSKSAHAGRRPHSAYAGVRNYSKQGSTLSARSLRSRGTEEDLALPLPPNRKQKHSGRLSTMGYDTAMAIQAAYHAKLQGSSIRAAGDLTACEKSKKPWTKAHPAGDALSVNTVKTSVGVDSLSMIPSKSRHMHRVNCKQFAAMVSNTMDKTADSGRIGAVHGDTSTDLEEAQSVVDSPQATLSNPESTGLFHPQQVQSQGELVSRWESASVKELVVENPVAQPAEDLSGTIKLDNAIREVTAQPTPEPKMAAENPKPVLELHPPGWKLLDLMQLAKGTDTMASTTDCTVSVANGDEHKGGHLSILEATEATKLDKKSAWVPDLVYKTCMNWNRRAGKGVGVHERNIITNSKLIPEALAS